MHNSVYLSVVICTYNRGRYLPMVLDSLNAQAILSDYFEVLVINNNSPDQTEEIIKEYKAKNPGFPLHYFLELNQGISFARNRGVEESSGEIIVFIDDDETVEPSFLAEINRFFKEYPDAGITAGPVVPVYETARPEWLSKYTDRLITGAYDKGHTIKLLPPKDYPGTGHACFRKRLFEKYGCFNTDLGRKGTSLMGAEDKDFFLRLMNGGEKCYYLPGGRIYHHIPASKLTESHFSKLTYSMGKSEHVRTLGIGKLAFVKRVGMEILKWGASFLLWLFYFFKGEVRKGNKLIVFRWNLSRGLLGL